MTGPAFAAQAERRRRELHVHCYRMLASFDDAAAPHTSGARVRLPHPAPATRGRTRRPHLAPAPGARAPRPASRAPVPCGGPWSRGRAAGIGPAGAR